VEVWTWLLYPLNSRSAFICAKTSVSEMEPSHAIASNLAHLLLFHFLLLRVEENTTKISEHVWVIMGFPNIAMVVGSHATLVVDTGLGPKNGATAGRVAARLAPNNVKLFLTTTHFHPEHAAGAPGVPPVTILIRDAVQQQEMEKRRQEMIEMLRPPDVTATIDVGGVTARLLWLGGAHTKGDELTFVEPDRTLISGDVVQDKTSLLMLAALGATGVFASKAISYCPL
jgi:glyoxylase-like metal-dependent hydrolase (beta-lactamase superfamily II)